MNGISLQAELKQIPGHDAQGIEHGNINSDVVSSVPEKKAAILHNNKPKPPTEREYLHQLWKAQAEKRAAEKKLQAEEDVRRHYRLPSQAPLLEREYSARLWARPEGARASCRIARKRQRGVTAARALVDLSEGGCAEDGGARDGALGEEESETKKRTIQRGSTATENQYGSLWDRSKVPPPKPRHVSPKQKQKQIEKKLQLRMQKYDSKYMPRKTASDPPTWEENYERTV